MELLKKVFAWVVFSSKDPNKFSLSVKGGIAGLATCVLFFSGWFNLGVDVNSFNSITDAIATVVKDFLTLVSSVAILWGLLRKIYLTFVGKNQVLVGWSNTGTN